MKNKRLTKRIFGGAWLLSVAAVLSKVLGLVYRIPLTRALGVHGMGLFQSVFPTYALLVTVTGGGLTAAVSKLVAENEDGGVAKTALCGAVTFAGFVSLIAAALSHRIAQSTGAPQATVALLILLPGIPLSAACAVLRGYFQGAGNLIPSALGQLIEQTVKLIVGLVLAFTLTPVALLAGVAGCAAGVTAGEFATAFYYWLRFLSGRKSAEKSEPPQAEESSSDGQTSADAVTVVQSLTEAATDGTAVFAPDAVADMQSVSSAIEQPTAAEGNAAVAVRRRFSVLSPDARQLLHRLLKIAFPITLGLMVLPLCQVADSFLIVNLLTRFGAARDTATALYGIVTGPVGSLSSMSSVLTVGLGSTLLPKVSACVTRGADARPAVRRAFCIAAAVGVSAAACLAAFAPLAVTILYGASLGSPVPFVASLVRLSVPSVACLSVIQIASAALQGCGKAFVPAGNLLIAAAVKEGLQIVLLPRLGIAGCVIATDVFYALACLLDCIATVRALRLFGNGVDPFSQESNGEQAEKSSSDRR